MHTLIPASLPTPPPRPAPSGRGANTKTNCAVTAAQSRPKQHRSRLRRQQLHLSHTPEAVPGKNNTGLRGQRPTGRHLPGEGTSQLIAAASDRPAWQGGGRQESCQQRHWHEKFRPVYTFVRA